MLRFVFWVWPGFVRAALTVTKRRTIMFNLLHSSRTTHRKLVSHRQSRPVCLSMEELEDRALPSTFGNLLAPTPLANNIQHDLKDLQSDVQAVTRSLASNTSTTVMTDLKTITTDLTQVAADLTGGVSASKDLTTLTTDLATLGKDLGNNLPSGVSHNLRDLGQDLRDLARDLIPPGPARGEDAEEHGGALHSGLKEVQSDIQNLLKALGSNTSTAVTADLKAIQTDLTSLLANFTAGLDLTQNLTQLTSDLTTLGNDLGSSVSSKVQGILKDLGNDLSQVSTDLTRISNRVTGLVNDLQSDLTKLTGQLPSSNATVTADLNVLDTALTTLAADISAGNSVSADISSVFKAEVALIGDLTGQLSGGVRASLLDIAFDLQSLGALKS
jgi:galactitol-specific phosphotransferase system IIB component